MVADPYCAIARVSSHGSVFGDALLRKVAWRLIPFLGLLYFIAFLDRVNVGFAALTMNADLGLSASAFGFGAGIFFAGYVLFEVPSNILLERLGARLWIARIMITWGALSAAMALAQGPLSFYVLRFLLGVAEAGFFPGVILYLTYWFPSAVRARIVGAFLIALPVSSVIGAPASTALLGLEALGLKGWQWLFVLEGLPAVLLGLVVLVWMTDRPEKARWLTEEEKTALSSVLAAERRTLEASRRYTLRQALVNGRVWAFGLIYFGVVTGLYGLALWLPQIIKGLGGLSNFQVGLVTAVPYAAAAAAMYLWGRHSDLTGERMWHVALPAFVGGAGLAASAHFGAMPLLALIALTLSAVGIYGALPAFWTLATGMLTGTAAAGGIALINSIGNIGGYVGPLLLGYFKDTTADYRYGLLILAVFSALAGVLTLALGRRSAQDQ